MTRKSPLDRYPVGTVIIEKKRRKSAKIRHAYQKDTDGEWYGAWGWECAISDPPESHVVLYKPGKDEDES